VPEERGGAVVRVLLGGRRRPRASPEPSYVGDQPFFLVSYGHADSDLVYPEMRWLQEAGFNLIVVGNVV
jgi:hypothetical protein